MPGNEPSTPMVCGRRGAGWVILGKDRGLSGLKREPNVPPRRAGGRPHTAAYAGVGHCDVWVLSHRASPRVLGGRAGGEHRAAKARGRRGPGFRGFRRERSGNPGEAGAHRGVLDVQGLSSALDVQAADAMERCLR